MEFFPSLAMAACKVKESVWCFARSSSGFESRPAGFPFSSSEQKTAAATIAVARMAMRTAGAVRDIRGSGDQWRRLRSERARDLWQEPCPPCGLVNPCFNQTCCSNVVVAFAEFVRGAEESCETLVVGAKLRKH